MLALYEQAEGVIADVAVLEKLKIAGEKLDIVYLKWDMSDLMNELKEGIARVKPIVQTRRIFACGCSR